MITTTDDGFGRSRRKLRAILNPWRKKDDTAAWATFCVDFVAWTAGEIAVVSTTHLPLKIIFGAITSVFVSRLFICAHDACHGSFFTSSSMNRLIGRIAFLPSLTPYSLWEAGHNVVHHSFTNLRGRDWVWTPHSLQEYLAFSPFRRWIERVYRCSWIGFGLYYMVELWWKRMFLPDRKLFSAKRTIYRWDRTLVVMFLLLQATAAYVAALFTGQDPVPVELTAVVVPFCLWNCTMGFVIYHHHTHPGIAWFDSREEWASNSIQIRNSVHILFPGPLNYILHQIMEHTAHHVDIGIPMYQLLDAQTELERMRREDVLIQPWSFHFFRSCKSICQLYDYKEHCWLDFAGNITARVSRVTKRVLAS